MKKIKEIFSKKRWEVSLVLLILIQPLIDLDYLWYGTFEQWGVPRFSTIIRFVVLPLLILWTYALQTKNKKKTTILGILYGVMIVAYTVAHCIQANALYDVMGFTTNFKFSVYQEIVYLVTLLLPLGIIYAVTLLNPTEKLLKKMVGITSAIVALPIFLSNLFVFGMSTYSGKAVANFFVWFSENDYHPRQLATKFFFAEGNTVGILLFILLPLLYFFFTKAKTQKEKIGWGTLIFIHSLSMQILGTRVATYGAILVPAYFLVLYLLDVALKHQQFKKSNALLPLVFVLIFMTILPYTPAVLNQKLNETNDIAIIESDISDKIENEKGEHEQLVPGTVEYNQFYIYMFEVYGIDAGYIHTVSQEYYIYYYNYKYDPVFWMQVIEMDPYDRLNGRQIQSIFMNYKMEELKDTDHFLGVGYSTFMNGSIILEQDFIQQWMTLGYIGFLLFMSPWLILLILFLFNLFKDWKNKFNLEILVYGAAFVSGLGVAVVSGHTMDQLMTSSWLAVFVAVLIHRLLIDEKGDRNDV